MAQKPIALIISLIFLIQNTVWASKIEADFWVERRRTVQHGSSELLAALPAVEPGLMSRPLPSRFTPTIKLHGMDPRIMTAIAPHVTMGTVYISPNPQAKTVFLMQDAHLHFEAQTHIAGLIDAMGRELEKKGSKLLVGMEGADFTTRNLMRLNNYPHRKELRRVAEAMLQKNMLNGAEFAAFGYLGHADKGPVRLPFFHTGVENHVEYQAHVKALLDAMAVKDKAQRELQAFSINLKALKKENFNPALLELDQKTNAYHAGTLSLPDYVLYLDSIVHAAAPSLRLLIEAALLEDSLDFSMVERERTRLLEDLVKKLRKNEIEQLMQLSLLLKSGHASHRDYYETLKQLSASHDVNFSKFPEMALYIQYVLKSEAIDKNKLFSDLKDLEVTAQKKRTRNKKEEAIAQLDRRYHLMEKLVNLEMTEAEWNEYSTPPGLPTVKRPISIISLLMGRTVNNNDVETVRGEESPFERFYELAQLRNHTMAARMAERLGKSNCAMGVLVVGGFHTEGLIEQLKARDVSIVTLSPKMTQLQDGPSSLDIIASGHHPIERLFKGERLFLPIEPVMNDGVLLNKTINAACAIADSNQGRGEFLAAYYKTPYPYVDVVMHYVESNWTNFVTILRMIGGFSQSTTYSVPNVGHLQQIQDTSGKSPDSHSSEDRIIWAKTVGGKLHKDLVGDLVLAVMNFGRVGPQQKAALEKILKFIHDRYKARFEPSVTNMFFIRNEDNNELQLKLYDLTVNFFKQSELDDDLDTSGRKVDREESKRGYGAQTITTSMMQLGDTRAIPLELHHHHVEVQVVSWNESETKVDGGDRFDRFSEMDYLTPGQMKIHRLTVTPQVIQDVLKPLETVKREAGFNDQEAEEWLLMNYIAHEIVEGIFRRRGATPSADRELQERAHDLLVEHGFGPDFNGGKPKSFYETPFHQRVAAVIHEDRAREGANKIFSADVWKSFERFHEEPGEPDAEEPAEQPQETSDEDQSVKAFPQGVDHVAFLHDRPNGQYVVASQPNRVHMFDRTGETPMANDISADGLVTALAVSSKGTRTAFGAKEKTNEGFIYQGYLHIAGKTFVLEGHEDEITTVRFSADGKTVATMGKNGQIFIWDEKGKKQVEISTEDNLTVIDFNPDGTLMAGFRDGSIKKMKISGKKLTEVELVRKNQTTIERLTVSPDGSRIAYSDLNNRVKVLTLGEAAPRASGIQSSITSPLVFSPDSQTIFWISDGVLKIFTGQSSETKAPDLGFTTVNSLDISPDGETMAVAGFNAEEKSHFIKFAPMTAVTAHVGWKRFTVIMGTAFLFGLRVDALFLVMSWALIMGAVEEIIHYAVALDEYEKGKTRLRPRFSLRELGVVNTSGSRRVLASGPIAFFVTGLLGLGLLYFGLEASFNEANAVFSLVPLSFFNSDIRQALSPNQVEIPIRRVLRDVLGPREIISLSYDRTQLLRLSASVENAELNLRDGSLVAQRDVITGEPGEMHVVHPSATAEQILSDYRAQQARADDKEKPVFMTTLTSIDEFMRNLTGAQDDLKQVLGLIADGKINVIGLNDLPDEGLKAMNTEGHVFAETILALSQVYKAKANVADLKSVVIVSNETLTIVGHGLLGGLPIHILIPMAVPTSIDGRAFIHQLVFIQA